MALSEGCVAWLSKRANSSRESVRPHIGWAVSRQPSTVFTIFGGGAFAGQGGLCFGDEHSKGCAQFMRGIRGELALAREGGFQTRDARLCG
jgi:hypothetical protein